MFNWYGPILRIRLFGEEEDDVHATAWIDDNEYTLTVVTDFGGRVYQPDELPPDGISFAQALFLDLNPSRLAAQLMEGSPTHRVDAKATAKVLRREYARRWRAGHYTDDAEFRTYYRKRMDEIAKCEYYGDFDDMEYVGGHTLVCCTCEVEVPEYVELRDRVLPLLKLLYYQYTFNGVNSIRA